MNILVTLLFIHVKIHTKGKNFPLVNVLLIDKLVVTLFVMCGNGWMEEVAFVIIMKRPYCSIAYYYAALGRANVS